MIPWFLNQLSARDEGGTLLRPLNLTLVNSVAAADVIQSQYRTNSEKYLILTNWSAKLISAGAALPSGVQLLIQQGATVIRDGGQRIGNVVASGINTGFWDQLSWMMIPPSSDIFIIGYYTAAAANQMVSSLQGCYVPRGYLPSDTAG